MSSAPYRLNAIRDPRHPSYKVPGLHAWLIIGLSVIGAMAFPRAFLAGARLLAFYLLARLIAAATFYVIGVLRCRAWERKEFQPSREDGVLQDVHHVVIIPNYKEPAELLQRTLNRLAEQDQASHRLTVVLAMEEKEAHARAKALALRREFAGRFAHILITVHPADRPGEIAGKGANQAWAARQAKRRLVDQLGIPISHLTLTSCDADSLLHPRYFAALTRLFASDAKRHCRFWHAPVFYHNNIWDVPAPIRVLAFSAGAVRLGELSNPRNWVLPTSTYTLSFKLAREVGYWDPAVIAEDWHMYLRCFFATGGQIGLTRIFLPTTADAIDGETLWQALINYYQQQVRHAWGAQDVGYILQQWRRSPATTPLKKLSCLLLILHLNLLRSTSWFVLVLGSLILAASHDSPFITWPGESMPHPDLLSAANAMGGFGAIAMWMLQRTRCLPRQGGRRHTITALAEELAAWALLPVLTLLFTTLPGLHAQTKLLLGCQLVYQRTPKTVRRGLKPLQDRRRVRPALALPASSSHTPAPAANSAPALRPPFLY